MYGESVPSSIYGSPYFILIIFSSQYSAEPELSIEVHSEN